MHSINIQMVVIAVDLFLQDGINWSIQVNFDLTISMM